MVMVKKRPFYNLMMFPYPSAEGLHVGNMYAFTAADVYGRFKRMQGFDVFEPIGLDGFGIHSENYALKIGRHPQEHARITQENFYKQLHKIGNMFDWSKTLETYDPDYYRWTQWIFVQMFKAGLAYRAKSEVNWCPHCKTVLADEQVIDGKCERCKTEVIKKELEQWFFRITKYADRLLAGLDKIDWSQKIKVSQRNWIGRSEGMRLNFGKYEVFTTRPETVHGATFLAVSGKENKFTGEKVTNPATGKEIPVWEADYVVADYGTGVVMGVPAHDQRDFEFAKKYHLDIVPVVVPEREYIDKNAKDYYHRRSQLHKDLLVNLAQDAHRARKKLMVTGGWAVFLQTGTEFRDFEDLDLVILESDLEWWREKFSALGFEMSNMFPGGKNPKFYFQATKKDIHVDIVAIRINDKGKVIWLDSVVPKESDNFGNIFEEKKIDNSIVYAMNKNVLYYVKNKHSGEIRWKEKADFLFMGYNSYVGPGKIINSGKYSGMNSAQAREEMIKDGLGSRAVIYHLRDWLISRQRYWGPPIPMIKCSKCGWQPVPEKDLPVLLPDISDYQPEGNGKGPLAKHPEFYKTKCPKCGEEAERETDVSDTFLDSAWYFLRYPSIRSAHSGQVPFDQKITRKWLPVAMYTGGAEHANLHLLYARFVTMALHDLGYLNFEEPFKRFFAHGMIIKDGAKMSKSKGNVVNPDDYIAKYGADALRLYFMFLGPVDQGGDFRDAGMEGMARFVKRVYKLFDLPAGRQALPTAESAEIIRLGHKLIKKVGGDIERRHYNTAISAIMEFVNAVSRVGKWSKKQKEALAVVLAPLAPFLAEEIWHKLGHKDSVHIQAWPEYDPRLAADERGVIVVQVNGKVRDTVVDGPDVQQRAVESDKVKKYLGGAKYRTIYVPGKIINFVCLT